MDQELKNKIEELDFKVNAIYASVEKTRKYFLTMLWVTLGAVVLPLIGLAFALPAFLNNYVGQFTDLGL